MKLYEVEMIGMVTVVKGTKFSRRRFLGMIAGGIITIIGMREYLNLLEGLGEEHANNISEIFIVKNGTSEQNVSKAVEMMGGISKIIESDSIVIVKPNCQWSGYGITNTNAIKGFIDLVLAHPEGFTGEIVIAENVHASNYYSDGDISNR